MSVAEAWAGALVLGVPDEVFWGSTPEETWLLISKLRERYDAERTLTEHNANVRFGSIAAEIVNQSPYKRRGTKRLTWRSFFKDAREEAQDTPGALRNALVAWAEATPHVKVNRA